MAQLFQHTAHPDGIRFAFMSVVLESCLRNLFLIEGREGSFLCFPLSLIVLALRFIFN